MIEFSASSVEVFSVEEGVLTVHFDDGRERYLQLQAHESDGHPDHVHEEGYGGVYVEVDDQINSGYNCFSLVELSRGKFRIVLARDPAVAGIGEVVATFDLDDEAFSELRRGLAVVFRSYPGYRDLAV